MQTIASVIRTPGNDVDKYLNTYIATLTKRVPTGTLLPSLLDIWQDTRSADEKVCLKFKYTNFPILTWIAFNQVLVRFFYVFQRTIRQADRARLPALVRTTFKFFLEALDLCHHPQFPTISEDHMLPAFLDLVEKLNEATFKPLFSRLYDWAVIPSEGSNIGKLSSFNPQVATELTCICYSDCAGHFGTQDQLVPSSRRAFDKVQSQ